MDLFATLARRLAQEEIYFVGTPTLKPVSGLMPRERSIIARARPIRQKQFATGRWCARRALRRLNLGPRAIGCGPAGEPLWPAGVCGSISHAAGACAAAAASTRRYQAIGLDVESRSRSLSRGALEIIANPDERRWLRRAGSRRREHEMIIFGAKECAFKLLYPLVRKPFGFDALSLAAPPAGGKAVVILRRRLRGTWGLGKTLIVRYVMDDHWIVMAAWWPPADNSKR